MAEHATFPPSASARWLLCAGSVALTRDLPATSNVYADEGTAAHKLADRALRHNKDADFFLGEVIDVNREATIDISKQFTVDDDMARAVQFYLDDVRRRSLGGKLYYERKLSLSHIIGEPDQFGTTDCAIVHDKYLVIEDYKHGMGEKVDVCTSYPTKPDSTIFCWKQDDQWIAPNTQLMLYADGALEEYGLLHDFEFVRAVVCQPRIDNLQEIDIPVAQFQRFRVYVAGRMRVIDEANHDPAKYLNPGEKQCRWCGISGVCSAQRQKISQEVFDDFAAIDTETAVAKGAVLPAINEAIAQSAAVVGLVEDWCLAVRRALEERVSAGHKIVGPDGEPYKIVEGRKPHRKWKDEAKAEGALVGILGTLAYEPKSIITPSAADKKLNKKKTAEIWKIFAKMIETGRGKPTVALGSDTRPPFTGTATADEFSDTGEDDLLS